MSLLRGSMHPEDLYNGCAAPAGPVLSRATPGTQRSALRTLLAHPTGSNRGPRQGLPQVRREKSEEDGGWCFLLRMVAQNHATRSTYDLSVSLEYVCNPKSAP